MVLSSCGGSEAAANASNLTGSVMVDGSSTVFPITEAVAEEFFGAHPKVRVTVGESGTGGGFKKFLNDETDINDASRPIKGSELEKAAEKGIEYIELPVAYDGIAIVVNKDNDFLETLTVEQLSKIWSADSKVTKWSDVNPDWPAEDIKLYGPGAASGTFDYFIEVILDKQAIRADFTQSEDDNVIVTGVAGDKFGLGFFGFAYWVENKDRLKLLSIDGGNGPITPSTATINDGTYAPLSRPLFIYVRKKALENETVKTFVDFFLENAATLAAEVGYVALPSAIHELTMKRYENGITGTMFGSGEGETLLQRMQRTTK